MKSQKGFTLVELMVVIAIIGILFVSAVPVYHTWQQRAYGSEAAIMIKQIMDAQIAYFLDNNKYFPPESGSIDVFHSFPSDHENIITISNNLNITIPSGHYLNYTLESDNNVPGQESFILTLSSEGGFDLFKDTKIVTYTLNQNGEITSTAL